MDETTTRILAAIELLENEPRWNNKKLSDRTKMMWVGWAVELFDSVDDFEAAVDMAIYGDEFFPSMKSLRAKIASDTASDATVEWQKVLKLANSRAHQELPTLDISFLSERTQAALSSIGGLAKVAATDDDKLNFLEKQFTKSHSTFGASQVKQINAINPPAVVKQIKGA